MDEVQFSRAAAPEQTAAVASFVSNLLRGFIGCGDGTTLKVQLPFRFDVVDVGYGIRITIHKDVLVDRPGVNPWLEYLDLYSTGRVVARLSKLGVSFDHTVRP